MTGNSEAIQASTHLVAERLSCHNKCSFGSKSVQKFWECGFNAVGPVVNTLEGLSICVRPSWHRLVDSRHHKRY
jgi:hypothetical protein